MEGGAVIMASLKEAFDRLETCAFCEHFDGGGLRLVEESRKPGAAPLGGDCLNSRTSPRFETTSDDTCTGFFRDEGQS